ncbi:DUF1963 domain-containing protein [Streptomyces sp. NPDC020747]|uniref:DUF1963 domain-containing protein n=1 Tax=Streptomyces sp. NPDC020747 TaxID=3365086 RepID=UPI00379C2D8F
MIESTLELPALRERIRQLLLESGWDAPDIDRVLETELPGMVRRRVSLSSKPTGAAPAFRLGGLPRLPADVAWPIHSSCCGLTLSYIGALDCAALPRDHLAAPLPDSGQVLFFYASDAEAEDCNIVRDPDAFAVLYVPDTVEAAERTPPESKYQPEIAERVDLYAIPSLELGLDHFYCQLPDEELERFDDAIRGMWNESEQCLDGVGGYPSAQQYPPEWAMARDEHERTGGDMEELEARARQEWMVLLHVFEFPTENGEYLNYMIRLDDLAAGRFDRVVLSVDDHD